jgi:hypothetical protein
MDASIKAEIRALMGQRDALEREIAERMARLTAPGQPGMDEPLVDREVRHRRRGLPRAMCGAPVTVASRRAGGRSGGAAVLLAPPRAPAPRPSAQRSCTTAAGLSPV